MPSEINSRVINFCNIVHNRRKHLLATRNQSNSSKAYQDRYIGVLAELCVNHFLGTRQEDFILDHGDYGFRPDIIDGDRKISIKSQDPSSQKIWGKNRFTFQDSDKRHIKAGAYTHLACVLINNIGWSDIDFTISYFGPIMPLMKKSYFVDAKESLKSNKYILNLNEFLRKTPQDL